MAISHHDRQDWGHGPNKPVRMWTADQIRQVMQKHYPANEGDCICAWAVPSVDITQDFTIGHLIEELEKL